MVKKIKKKILMISHSSNGGGAETVFFKVVNTLKDFHEVTVCLPQKKGFLFEQFKDEKKIKLIIIRSFSLNNNIFKLIIGMFLFNPLSMYKLIKYVKKENIEIVYSSSIINYIGGITCKILGVKHIFHIHEMNNIGYTWINNINKFLIKKIIKNSTTIFLSNIIKKSWLKKFDIEEKDIKSTVIYNPLKNLKLKSRKKNLNKLVIGCAGTFCKNKNQKLLIETFIRLKVKYPNIFLKLAGEGNLKGAFPIIKKKLLEDDYEINDYINIEDFFNEIDIFVLPSFSEAWPLVIFEALSMEAVCVASTESSLNEILKDEKNILYFNPYDSDELYFKLEKAIKNFKEIELKMKIENKKILKKYNFNNNFENQIKNLFNE